MAMKILKPIIRFVEESSLLKDTLNNDFINKKYNETLTTLIKIEHTMMNACIFENIDFSKINLNHVSFLDCQFIKCNFMKNDLSKTNFTRVEFIQCNFLNVSFYKSTLSHVSFENCSAKYTNFSESKMSGVQMKDSFMLSSYFTSVDVQSLLFYHVNLNESEIFHTSLKGCDLTTCDLAQVRLDLFSIQGSKVNTTQAFSILKMLGIEIKE